MSAAVKDLQKEMGDSKAALLTERALEEGKNGSGSPTSASVAIEDDDGSKRKGSDQQGGKVIVVVRERMSGAFKEATKTRKGLTWTGHVIAVLVPFLSMLIGGIYIESCPANRFIPIYLIVAGAISALTHISTSLDIFRELPYAKSNDERKPAILILISIFMFIWVILGCVWTFSLYFTVEFEPWSMYPRGLYCHYTLYWFAFWMNIFAVISWVFGLCVCCCVCGSLCQAGFFSGSSVEKKSQQEVPPEVKV